MDVLNLYRGSDSRSILTATEVQPTMPNQDVLAQAFGGQSVQEIVHVHLPSHLPTFRMIQAFR